MDSSKRTEKAMTPIEQAIRFALERAAEIADIDKDDPGYAIRRLIPTVIAEWNKQNAAPPVQSEIPEEPDSNLPFAEYEVALATYLDALRRAAERLKKMLEEEREAADVAQVLRQEYIARYEQAERKLAEAEQQAGKLEEALRGLLGFARRRLATGYIPPQGQVAIDLLAAIDAARKEAKHD